MTSKLLNSTALKIEHDLVVEYCDIDTIKVRDKNPRRHPKQQIKRLAAGMEEYGNTTPLLIDESRHLIAGHCRLAAAKSIGLKRVPTIMLRGLTPAQIKAYAIFDNKIPELSEWDLEILNQELNELDGLDFDLELTGFDMGEIDQLVARPATVKEELQESDLAGPPQTRPGDRWTVGRHCILCADARDEASYRDLLLSEVAQMIFTDPPYNVAINGHVSGKGSIKHREFAMASGEMSDEEFIAFLVAFILNLVKFSRDGSIHYLCIDWKHVSDLMTAASRHYAELKNLVVWTKTNAGMGTFYRSQHELIAVYKNGRAKHINNFGLGESGRHRSNVWPYAGMNTLTRERMEELQLHPTVKPVALVADAIRDCSKRGGIILDPFCGSGTTILAAEITGRRAFTLEIDPAYVDVAIRRWQRVTGEVAVRQDGVRFQAQREGV